MFATERVKLLAERVRPTAPSRTRLLPVLPPLASLLPDGGLRRGTAVRCGAGPHGGGALSLALALAAGPSAAGSWCAVVGVEDIGVLAAAGFGVDTDRLAVVRVAAAHWALATGVLIDGVDVVVVAPPSRPRAAAVRTLAARARDRGAVLLVVGAQASWPADHELVVEQSSWHGLADGAGRLQARRATVVARGRGSAVRPVRQELWLPTATGKVAAA
jgi:hypothetical protein